MKKLLLLSSLLLGSFYAHAQLSCATAKDITTPGVYTVAAVAGSNQSPDAGGCVQATTTESGAALKGAWYKYTSPTPGRVTITSDLPENVAPKSTNTLLTVLVGDCSTLLCYDAADDISTENLLSALTFTAEANVSYYIMWSNYWSGAGFNFEVSVNPCVEPETIYLNSNITTTSATLNWEAAVGNPAQYEVTYIDLSDPNFTEQTKIVDTNSADLTNLTKYGNYYFFLRSICSQDSASEYVGPFLLSLLKEPTYSSNFDNVNEVAPWTQAVDDYTFGLIQDASEAAQSKPNFYAMFNDPEFVANNWLFSPGVILKKDQEIYTTFYLASNSSVDNRSLKVTIGTAPTQDSQTTTMYSSTTLKNFPWTKFTTPTYKVPADGVYYIGINEFSGLSTTDPSFMLFDTFSLQAEALAVEDFFSKQFSLYPNPANNVITITNSADVTVNAISIFDFNGRMIKSEKFDNISNINVKVSDLANGVYFININSDKGVATKKFVKN